VTATVEPRAQPRRELPSGPRTGAGRQGEGFWALLALVVVLDIVGLVMVLSASSVHDLRAHHSPWYSFVHQLAYLVAGAGLMAVVVRVDYRAWRRLAQPLMAVSLLLLVVVLVPHVGVMVSGSRRWLDVGPVQFQPSELAKLALALFAADLLDRRAGQVHLSLHASVPAFLALAAAAALVMKQPDLGTTIVLASVVVAALFVGGVRLPTMAALGALAASATLALGMIAPYRRARLLSFMHPLADSSDTGYQSVQGLVALSSGRLTGVGLGASRAKWGFLPNAHTDFIFAIIGDELGLLCTLLVTGLFVAFAVLGVRAAMRAPDRFGTLLAAGITTWVVGQAVINIGAVVGLLPVTGVPLPFISYGGSALVVTMGATAILLNIARQGRPRPQVAAAARADGR
jgi:cell division protein FtsW